MGLVGVTAEGFFVAPVVFVTEGFVTGPVVGRLLSVGLTLEVTGSLVTPGLVVTVLVVVVVVFVLPVPTGFVGAVVPVPSGFFLVVEPLTGRVEDGTFFFFSCSF